MNYNSSKFKNLVLYICWKVDEPSRLGATKLNKILWFSDILTYLNFNAPITGARYIKRQYGPAPAAIIPVIEELKNEGLLAVRDVEYYNRSKREFFALAKPDISQFSGDEISTVDQIIDQICDKHTAKSISDFTHNKTWEMAEIGETLPYETIFASRRGEIDETDIAWADQKLGVLASV